MEDDYEGYKKGYNFIDISVGLRTIITGFYEAQEAIDKFAKSCPRNSFASQALKFNDLKTKVEIILKVAKAAQAKPVSAVERDR